MGQGLGSKYLGEIPTLVRFTLWVLLFGGFNLETDTVLIDFGFSPNVLDGTCHV